MVLTSARRIPVSQSDVTSMFTDSVVKRPPCLQTEWWSDLHVYRLSGEATSMSTDWVVKRPPCLQTEWWSDLHVYRLWPSGEATSISTDWVVKRPPCLQTEWWSDLHVYRLSGEATSMSTDSVAQWWSVPFKSRRQRGPAPLSLVQSQRW